MAKPPALWAFLLANTGLFISSGLLTALCYLAYRRSNRQPSFQYATIGFGFIVLGGLVEPLYQFARGIDYTLNGTELLFLQGGEGVLLTVGLGLLFYAIIQHEPSSGAASTRDEQLSWGTKQDGD